MKRLTDRCADVDGEKKGTAGVAGGWPGRRLKKTVFAALLALLMAATAGCEGAQETGSARPLPGQAQEITLDEIAAYSGEPYAIVNGNVPYFTEDDRTDEPFEHYSKLDALGRCGAAFANICRETMPTEERGAIGHVRPSGWHTVKYDSVDGKYLYNRCHLIGYQLSAENDNEQNLITGTRYLNTEGMLPFENEVADYVRETDGHVLYRVTPLFEGDNLLADGVLMEAYSVEDDGAGVCFNVFVYNVQPGIGIDLLTGESWLEDTDAPAKANGRTDYILNTNTMKFHAPSCASVDEISRGNKREYSGTREELIEKGYEPCGRCRP